MILDLSRNPEKYVTYNNVPEKTPEPYFTDLSIKRNFEAEKNIEVSMVMPDSNYLPGQPTEKRSRKKHLNRKLKKQPIF